MPNPGHIEKLLVGAGRAAVEALPEASRAVEASGFAMPRINPGSSFWQRRLNGTSDFLFGYRPIETVKQRFAQGGLFGRGGILRGSLAFHPDFEKVRAEHGLLAAVKAQPMHAFTGALGNTFTTGIPAYAAYKHHQQGQPIGRDIVEGLTFTAAQPFMLATTPILHAAHAVTDPFLQKPKLPPISQPRELPPADYNPESAARFNG